MLHFLPTETRSTAGRARDRAALLLTDPASSYLTGVILPVTAAGPPTTRRTAIHTTPHSAWFSVQAGDS